MTSAGAVGSTRVGVLGEMTRRLGEVRARAATMVAALLLIATLLPGPNWTLAPLDPAFASGGYALISVGRGAAEAVADEARALGADDVASLDSIDVVSARVTSSALDSLRRDARVAFIASDAIVTAAPDAKLISLRVLDAQGRGTMHSVLAAFDWVLHNRAAYHVKVLNLSFGAPQTTTYHRTLLAGVVESAWFAGVTVVTAAGNDGPKPGTVAMPGADPFVVTAGSFDDQGTTNPNDDRESALSS